MYNEVNTGKFRLPCVHERQVELLTVSLRDEEGAYERDGDDGYFAPGFDPQ